MYKMFRTYYWFIWQYKSRFLLFVFALIIARTGQSLQPYLYKLFVDAIPTKDMQTLWLLLFIFIGLRIFNVFANTLMYWLGDLVLLPLARDIRITVFNKVQELDFAFHLSKSTGSLISSFKRGDGAVFNFFHSVNVDIASVMIQFLVMSFFLARLGWQYVLLISLTFCINLFFALLLVRKNVTARKEFNDAEDEISGIIVDNMINYETVKLFANEAYELSRLKDSFVDWMDKLWGYANSFRLIDITIGLSGNLGYLLILSLALHQFSLDLLSAGDFIMVLTFVANFYIQFFELTFRLRDLAKNQADIEKYFESLEMTTLVKDPEKPQTLNHVKGEISFENVSFSYGEGKKKALKNIDLRIRQGQSIALVGHSGVGKTTLVKLLMRLFDPTKGAITIDGVDIRDMTKSHLRSHLGIVPQDPILFNNTLEYNVLYGAQDKSRAELIAAIKMANLEDFVNSLPQGYQTQVGERGVKLSGGQKQRLAIARMILSNPEIIIFDEATSQLDSESEQKIQEAFWRVSKDKTTIIVAHRLSTVVRADKIIVMEYGRIKEMGSHRELLQKDGLYAHFWKLQTLE